MDTGYKAACAPFFSEERIVLHEQWLLEKGWSDIERFYMRQIWSIDHSYHEYMKNGGDRNKGRARRYADANYLWELCRKQPDFNRPKPDLGY